MNHKMLACLSESHFKDFLLSEITFFLVFESMQNCVKRIIEWVQRKRNQFTRSKEYNSKIKIFFAGNSGIIEITSCDQLHRKKLPEIIFVRWVTHSSHLPRGPNFVQNLQLISFIVDILVYISQHVLRKSNQAKKVFFFFKLGRRRR